MRRPGRGSSQGHWTHAAQDTQPHPNDLGQFRVLQNPGATYGYFAQGVLAIRHLHPTAFLSFVLIAYNFLPDLTGGLILLMCICSSYTAVLMFIQICMTIETTLAFRFFFWKIS